MGLVIKHARGTHAKKQATNAAAVEPEAVLGFWTGHVRRSQRIPRRRVVAGDTGAVPLHYYISSQPLDFLMKCCEGRDIA